jgi:hypothetical protein
MRLFAWVLLIFAGGAFIKIAIEFVRLVKAAGRMLRGWDVDWLGLTGTLILAIVLAHQSWEVMFGVVICMYLAKGS